MLHKEHLWNGVFRSILSTTERCSIIPLEKRAWSSMHYYNNIITIINVERRSVNWLHLCVGLHVLQELSQQGGGEGQVSHPELLQTLQPTCTSQHSRPGTTVQRQAAKEHTHCLLHDYNWTFPRYHICSLLLYFLHGHKYLYFLQPIFKTSFHFWITKYKCNGYNGASDLRLVGWPTASACGQCASPPRYPPCPVEKQHI